MAAAHLPVMQTTPTTATIALSGKRVRNALRSTLPVSNASLVCVSDALVAEIKRIVKDSEILKYVEQWKRTQPSANQSSREDDTKWPQKNKDGRQELEIRLGSEHISFEVGLTMPMTCLDIDDCRLQRSAPSRTCRTRRIQKASVFSTTWYRTSRLWSSP